MEQKKQNKSLHLPLQIITGLLVLLLAACGPTAASPTADTAASAPPPTETIPPTPTLEPTPTPEPFVALVNGEGIPDSLYQASLLQYQAANPLVALDEAASQVLEDLIATVLLAQGARAQGQTASEDDVQAHIAQLTEQAGGAEALAAWQQANGYTAESFALAVRLDIEASWMRQAIFAQVPTEMEQIEARQVLFYDSFQALRALDQLKNDTPFDTIVINNDPQNLGYLGWFPRGYLLFPAVEDAAFALQPGQFSEVIETDLGYHLIEVLDRQDARPLAADARLVLQTQALQAWVAQQRQQSQVQLLHD